MGYKVKLQQHRNFEMFLDDTQTSVALIRRSIGCQAFPAFITLHQTMSMNELQPTDKDSRTLTFKDASGKSSPSTVDIPLPGTHSLHLKTDFSSLQRTECSRSI